MPTLFLALVGSVLAALASRPARLVAQLSASLGGSKALLAASWLTAALASALAAWLGAVIAPSLTASDKALVVAAALAVAALGLAWPARPQRPPTEPTRSLGAIALVLGLGQAVDAARLLVFALSIAAGNAAGAALGATIGSGVALALAWKMQARWLPFSAIRLATSAVLIVTAASALWFIG